MSGHTKSGRPTWESLKALALGLDLPGVEETTSWGQPCLKAHKKLWVWWSPHEDAPVFKVPFEEREMLVEADPGTFFYTNHYKNHGLVLVRPERLDLEWARANLLRVWRAQAPKRLLKDFDGDQGTAVPAEAPGTSDLPTGLTTAARQALRDGGIDSVAALSRHSRAAVAALPGIGPATLKTLSAALSARGLDFSKRGE
ncbi:MAG: MmcQ/YjbR family DNA-binding protein [Alphaproteobacteria bacterium]